MLLETQRTALAQKTPGVSPQDRYTLVWAPRPEESGEDVQWTETGPPLPSKVRVSQEKLEVSVGRAPDIRLPEKTFYLRARKDDS